MIDKWLSEFGLHVTWYFNPSEVIDDLLRVPERLGELDKVKYKCEHASGTVYSEECLVVPVNIGHCLIKNKKIFRLDQASTLTFKIDCQGWQPGIGFWLPK